MRLLEDPPLAVSKPTFRELSTALENARSVLGINTDIYQRRIQDVLTNKRLSPDHAATKKISLEVRALLFMQMLDLDELLQGPLVSKESGTETFPRLYQAPETEEPTDPDNNPHILAFSADIQSTLKIWGTGVQKAY